MYGNTRLLVRLNILINMFLIHCHIPTLFMQSVIVPLIKCKEMLTITEYRAKLLYQMQSQKYLKLF
jgi:hypothetical protein